MPLLRAMHRESGGVGAVIEMPDRKHWAAEVRAALECARVTRPETFATTGTSKRVRFDEPARFRPDVDGDPRR